MSLNANVERLREAAPAVLPSLLLCDFSNLEREVRRLEAAGAEALHLDVMDGCFVPNITYGMPIVAAARRLTDLPLDVHLMIMDPAKYVAAFCEAGADVLTIHVETNGDSRPVLEHIRKLGMGAGLALDPATPLSRIESCLDLCDLVLVMSVPAGFGKQPFAPVALDKLRQVREMTDPRVMVEVDGGVNRETIGSCARAGAGLFVVGSAIFSQDQYGPVLDELSALARGK